MPAGHTFTSIWPWIHKLHSCCFVEDYIIHYFFLLKKVSKSYVYKFIPPMSPFSFTFWIKRSRLPTILFSCRSIILKRIGVKPQRYDSLINILILCELDCHFYNMTFTYDSAIEIFGTSTFHFCINRTQEHSSAQSLWLVGVRPRIFWCFQTAFFMSR